MRTDVIVLGAGMVGISAALHLQARGRSVVLADRRGPAEETSHGNAGVIQREAVVPYGFPRDASKLARYALNRLPEANLHWTALPAIAPWLVRYWWHGTPRRIDASARAARPLIERCLDEHGAFMQAAGIPEAGRPTGYLKVFRTQARLEALWAEQSEHARKYGIAYQLLDAAGVKALEPHLADGLAGGILATEPLSVTDPGALGKAYAGLLVKRGGRLATVDARTLEASGDGWLVRTVDGPIHAREVVISLGAWSSDVMAAQARPVPMGVKRGYHMHYTPHGNAVLSRPVIDAETGYVLAPMTRGIRLTTGAEFARRDAAPTPVQLAKVEPVARTLFPLAERVDEKPWMGCRPCLPDMLPMIGQVPGRKGLWADFGHHHLGFTMGPVTGRLLAEMVTGEATFTDPFPYRVGRF